MKTPSFERRTRWVGAVLIAMTLTSPVRAEDTDVARLAEELELLKAQLAELEQVRERVRDLETRLEEAVSAGSVAQAETDKRDRSPLESDNDSGESATNDRDDAAEDGVTLNGALRFTGYWTDFNESVQSKRGSSGLDIFRIGAEGRSGNILMSAEYRFYPYMDVLHHGWIGYEFEDSSRIEAGVTKVPFGLLPYAAHNFWFGVPYYLGLSDDYDVGVKYVRNQGPWDWRFAFFKNGDLENAGDFGRYGYDVVTTGDQANEEINQLNLRGAYTLGRNTTCSHEIGVSGQFGELYNNVTDRKGSRWAAAAHLDSRCGRWNIQFQAARYHFDPENPPGVDDATVTLGGFEGAYDISSQGTVLVANVAYNLPVSWESVDQVTCYNDYSIVLNKARGFDDSALNTTGCLVGLGPLYFYLDVIRAENMVFFGRGSLAGNSSSGWDTRLNFNVGYYW